jgi:hypothetical protein
MISGKKLLIATAGAALVICTSGCPSCAIDVIYDTCTVDGCGGEGGHGGEGGDMAAGASGSGGAGGEEPCVRCGIFLFEGGTLCMDNAPNPASPDSSSQDLYTAYFDCICGDSTTVTGSYTCGMSSTIDTSCADNMCMGKEPSVACEFCIQLVSTDEKACSGVYINCANDLP